jgi:hypothetical protein
MLLSAKAKLAATVDFPTPPLQLLMPMRAPTWRSDGGAAFPIKELGLAMLELTLLLRTQGSAFIVSAIACSMETRCGQTPPLNSSLTAT